MTQRPLPSVSRCVCACLTAGCATGLKYKLPVYVHIVFENYTVRSAAYIFHFRYTGLRVRLHGHEGKNQNMTLAWGTTEILKYDLIATQSQSLHAAYNYTSSLSVIPLSKTSSPSLFPVHVWRVIPGRSSGEGELNEVGRLPPCVQVHSWTLLAGRGLHLPGE